jgi:hypothetical protein
VSKANPITALLTSRRLEFLPLDKPAADQVITVWWESFSSKNSPSSWLNRKMFWHCFSFGQKPYLAYDAAVRAYETVAAKRVWLLAVARTVSVVEIQKQDIPVSTLRDLQEKQILDLYVLDKAGRWTFVVTHEDACKLGPYFSRREWNPVSRLKV